MKHRRATRSSAAMAILLAALLAGSGPVSAGTLTLTWVSHALDELSVSIERSRQAGAPFAVIATVAGGVAAFTDVTEDDGTTYCYRVRTVTASAYSAYSNVACSPPVEVTLSLNAPRAANGDDLTLFAAVRVHSEFDNPIDAYVDLLAPSGAVSRVMSYLGVDIPTEDFTAIAAEGTVVGLAPGTYTLTVVIVRAGGDAARATDRLSAPASISFAVP